MSQGNGERSPLLQRHLLADNIDQGTFPKDASAENISTSRSLIRSSSPDSIMSSNISTVIATPAQADARSTEEKVGEVKKAKKLDRGKLVRDAIIGFSDGLTVPFALTAGLSSLGSTRIVVIGGLAELCAGSISMGLGAYLAATTESKHYDVQKIEQHKAIREGSRDCEEHVYTMFDGYGISREECAGVVAGLKANPEAWIRFTMDMELKLEREDTAFACLEGTVMGISYFFGGLLPMIPYFAIRKVMDAFYVSIGVTVLILLIFGYAKAKFTGNTVRDCAISALQTLVVGVVAAGVSYGIVKAMNDIDTPT